MIPEGAPMIDPPSGARLLRGLVEATQGGRLIWTESTVGRATASALYLSGVGLGHGRAFRAQKGGTSYELRADNLLGKAPYTLDIYEIGPSAKRALVGSLESSTSVHDPTTFELNAGLDELYKLVNSSVESGDELVERLLDELDR